MPQFPQIFPPALHEPEDAPTGQATVNIARGSQFLSRKELLCSCFQWMCKHHWNTSGSCQRMLHPESTVQRKADGATKSA